jgi:hypothetical protein
MGRDENTPAWVQHLAMEVGSMDELLAAKERLVAAGIDVIGPTNHTGPFAAAARLPVGRRLGLHQPRRAGAQGARRRGAASFYTDPLMYQGGSDSFVGPRDPIAVLSEEWGVDLEAEVAVVTGDVPMGASAEQARGRSAWSCW